MENLIFSLNATVPIFLLMVLGLFFQKIGWISESFAMEMNRFVFLIPLPVMVFEDFSPSWYCFYSKYLWKYGNGTAYDYWNCDWFIVVGIKAPNACNFK